VKDTDQFRDLVNRRELVHGISLLLLGIRWDLLHFCGGLLVY
jgi:hypothetical protein